MEIPRLPIAFIDRIKRELDSEADAFLAALENESIPSLRIHPFKLPHFELNETPIPWAEAAYYVPNRTVFASDPLWHAGAYYVQESSSMFLSHVLHTLLEKHTSPLVLDLCAAPGGKSTLLSTFLFNKNGFVVANEVIQGRVASLRENILKWGLPNVWVTHRDASFWGSKKEVFDCILIDAPCSGEGMFRKDPQSRREWKEESPAFCSARQKRIVEEALPALNNNGYLIYSTCTFNSLENGEIVSFLESKGLEPIEITIDPLWGVTPHEKGYAFWPHKVKGEGFFIAVFKKTVLEPTEKKEHPKKEKKIKEKVRPFSLEAMPFSLLNEWEVSVYDNYLLLTHPAYEPHFERLADVASKSDICWRVAEIKGKDIVPVPESAFLVTQVLQAHQTVDLNYEQAMVFLRKEDPLPGGGYKGWILLKYRDVALGWMKGIGSRNNNHFPPAYRLLKSKFEKSEEL